MPQAVATDIENMIDAAPELDLSIEVIDDAAEVAAPATTSYCSCECW